MRRSMVDLPQPDGPMIETNSFSFDSKGNVSKRFHRLCAGVDVASHDRCREMASQFLSLVMEGTKSPLHDGSAVLA